MTRVLVMSVFWTRQSWLKEQWLSLGPVQHQYLIRVLMRDMLNSHTRSHNDILIREFELQNSRKLGSDIVAEQALSYVSKTLSVLWVQLDNSRKEDRDVDFYEERRLWCEEMSDVRRCLTWVIKITDSQRDGVRARRRWTNLTRR